mmetsp:Transcript_9719/g.21624  ORF Transcript_9719/g.21624 Transcript_9719/m.21624 type:complete len:510 (+) Transcript_9719:77-1606(+)
MTTPNIRTIGRISRTKRAIVSKLRPSQWMRVIAVATLFIALVRNTVLNDVDVVMGSSESQNGRVRGSSYTTVHDVNTMNINTNFPKRPPKPPIIYNDMSQMPNISSSGPNEVNNMGGLYEYTNVCLTRHISGTELQGILYLQPNDAVLLHNRERCKPRSAPLNHHQMVAVNVADYSYCNAELKLDEYQHVPSLVETVHYFEDPVISLNFNMNIGHSLFDYLLVYLPHWYAYRSNNNFPFGGVISHVMDGCLDEDNSFWFCEILRSMNAFGEDAIQLPHQPDDGTLYCYKSLYLIHIAHWQKKYAFEGHLTKKPVFDTFRDLLFDEFELKRGREYHLQEKMNETQHSSMRQKRLLFYSHAPSGRRVWNGMNELIERYRNEPKYKKEVHFHIVHDFGAYSAREQAALFNEADAIVMVHGAQMGNSIFSVDGTLFVEIGCRIPTYIGNPLYMALLEGQYKIVNRCKGGLNKTICLTCVGKDDDYDNFTMTSSAFQSMVDDVLVELDDAKDKQ